MNIVGIAVGIVGYIVVKVGADKFIFKEQTDIKKVVWDLAIVSILITVSSLLTRKLVHKEGLNPPIKLK